MMVHWTTAWFLAIITACSYAEKECQKALGMENGAIADGQITASSQYSSLHKPKGGRLHLQGSATQAGSWSSSGLDSLQWLQIDLGDQYTSITRVATQGRHLVNQWVTKYKLQYSSDGSKFEYYKGVQGQSKDFLGNADQNTVVSHELDTPIRARYIRFRPTEWHGHISMRVELYGCIQECKQPLGMANGAIVDEQISASSEWSRAHRAAYGRLFYTLNSAAWVASDANPWFQIDLRNEHTKVTRIATQGRSRVAICCQWVKTYSLQFSADGKSFSYYKEEGQISKKVFNGNTDSDTVVSHDLDPPIWTRFIRFLPMNYYKLRSMRFEVYGCRPECQDQLGMENGLILDTQISASSYWSEKYAPFKSRLHKAQPNWVSSKVDTDQWLQIDVLGTNGKYTKVTRIATQGRANESTKQWVTQYKVQYSNDGLSFTNYTEKGQTTDKVFVGNSNGNDFVFHELNPPIRARFIRFRPLAWNEHISMRVELFGCLQDCTAPSLGMENGKIADSQITASSEFSPAFLARLNGRSAWCSRVPQNDSYIQIDLKSRHRVYGVATQGNPTVKKDYLKEYKLAWSLDSVTWETSVETLTGNTNWRDVIKHSIPVIQAQYIRLYPLKWHIWPCTRMEIYGEPWPQVPSTLFKGTSKAAPSAVMTSKITNDVTECTKLCLVTEQCKSFYYSQKMMRCEMIGADTGNQELQNKSDFYYYERIAPSLMFP
ncbi:uncharacterized protein LOC114965136 [Acropora millepora]|uniref:uncharacterized protein LOC114965136 n=1 Tax=Acropora millepora TaxID=45264 RepID=UPI001CF51DD5|nr:uncharacterized protein LOC114965136 [Acropora millepora]